MGGRAPRRSTGAGPVLALTLALAAPASACEGVSDAAYAGPTDRYPHGALGDPLEWSALTATAGPGCPRRRADLPVTLVFEDTAPRLADLDGDGRAELLTVEAHRDGGARLAVWALGPAGLARRAATPFIGTRFRWLAPVGAADLDGDGRVEVAYVDRPHLARVLRVWRWQDGALVPVAATEGLTNHRFGVPDISGGIRRCGGRPEMVLASADWRRLVAVRLTAEGLVRRDIGPHHGPGAFAAALACRSP